LERACAGGWGGAGGLGGSRGLNSRGLDSRAAVCTRTGIEACASCGAGACVGGLNSVAKLSGGAGASRTTAACPAGASISSPAKTMIVSITPGRGSGAGEVHANAARAAWALNEATSAASSRALRGAAARGTIGRSPTSEAGSAQAQRARASGTCPARLARIASSSSRQPAFKTQAPSWPLSSNTSPLMARGENATLDRGLPARAFAAPPMRGAFFCGRPMRAGSPQSKRALHLCGLRQQRDWLGSRTIKNSGENARVPSPFSR